MYTTAGSPLRTVLIANETQAIWVRRFILLLAMLMSGGHVFIPREPLLALLILTCLLVINLGSILRRELARIWIFFLAIVAVSLIGAGEFVVADSIIRFANFIAALLLLITYLDYPGSRIVEDIFPILIFFSLQAIFTPIMAVLAPGFFIDIFYEDVVYHSLGGLFIYHDTADGFFGLQRPDGWFFEPGVLQIYLNLLLYFSLFQRRRLFHAGLAVVAVATTQSTTGLVISMMLCGFAVLAWIRETRASSSVLALAVAPFAFGPVVYLTYVNLIDKLFGATRTSTMARSFDTETGLRIVEGHPIFGIGFSKERFQDEFRSYGRAVDSILGSNALDRTMSNGLVHVMVVLGIPLFLVFVYALWKQRLLARSSLLGVVVLLSMTTEALLLTPFFLAIVLSGLIISRRGVSPVTTLSPRFRQHPAVRR